MISVIYLSIALILYSLVYVQSRDIFHPLGIGATLWLMACALANCNILFDYSLQIDLSLQTNICMLVASFSFVFPVFFTQKKHSMLNAQRINYGRVYRVTFNFIIYSIFISFIIRFNANIFSPSLFFGQSEDLKNSVPEALPFVNYIDILTPYMAILSFMELKFSLSLSQRRRFFLILYIIFSLISALVYKISRGEFLIFALAYIYILLALSNKVINCRKMILIAIFSATFISIGAIRLSNYSRASMQFGDGPFNVMLSQLYTYIAMNFQNLNSLINSYSEPTFVWGSLKFILKPFFWNDYDTSSLGIQDYSVLFFNAKTFIYYFYSDLGMAGVIFYPFIIGVVIQFFYNKACGDIKYYVLIASLMKAIVFMFFGNYFFGELVVLFPYIVVLFFISTMQTIHIKES